MAKINNGLNIVFAEGISLPIPPPQGLVIEATPMQEKSPPPNLSKRWRITTGGLVDTSDTFKALRDIFEAMERLYEWALGLPEYNTR